MKLTPKQKTITIASAVLVCAAVGLMALLGCFSHREYASGELTDALYPCTWAENRNGCFVITFTGELPENSAWTALTGSDAIKVEQDESAAVFTVKPISQGVSKLWLSLRESGGPMPRGEDYEFTFSVEKRRLKLYMTCSDASAKALAAEKYETENGSIYWKKQSDGGLVLKAEDADWYCETLTGVTTIGSSLSGEGAGLEVVALEDSKEWSMILRHDASGNDCKVTFSYTDGVLSVAKCAPVPKAEEAEPSALETFLAEIEAEEDEAGTEKRYKEYSPKDLEARLQKMSKKWVEKFGREPDEAELEGLRSYIIRR